MALYIEIGNHDHLFSLMKSITIPSNISYIFHEFHNQMFIPNFPHFLYFYNKYTTLTHYKFIIVYWTSQIGVIPSYSPLMSTFDLNMHSLSLFATIPFSSSCYMLFFFTILCIHIKCYEIFGHFPFFIHDHIHILSCPFKNINNFTTPTSWPTITPQLDYAYNK